VKAETEALRGGQVLASFRAWLKWVPISNDVERALAATAQAVCFVLIAWSIASVYALTVNGKLGANGYDVAVVALVVIPTLTAAIVLLRTARYRAGFRTAVAGIAAPIYLLLVHGVEYSLPRFALVAIPLAAAALLLGRRALWIALLGALGALGIAAMRDAGHFGGPPLVQRAPVPLGILPLTILSYVVLAVVLDRFGGLLRDALSRSLRRELELQVSEQRFRTLSSLGTEGVLVNSGGIVLDANHTFARLVGVAGPAELVGRNGLDVIPFTPRSRDVVRERIRAGGDDPYELELVRPDGRLVPVEVSARSIVFDGREARLVVMRDISFRRTVELERARREAELRASEERFRLVFEASPDAMILVRLSDAVLVEVNDAFERSTGYRAIEMVGRRLVEQDLWVRHEQRDWLMQRFTVSESVHDLEAEFRRKDGSTMTGLISISQVSIERTPYGLGIIRDITDRKRYEQERDRLQNQLRQAQKLEAIGRLAGGIAHDFNNVLTSILASAQLVKDELRSDHPCIQDIQQIDADAHRAADLTRQLLAFARKQEIVPQIVSVETRAQGLEKMLRRVVGASVVIDTSYTADGWPVFIDPGQLEQVIVNLAVNARDAMPSGGRLAISTQNVTVPVGMVNPGVSPGDYLLLSVTDTGRGMAPDVVAHAFEPFFSTKGDQGTGLGLATCYGIVTQAGGTIAIDSALGAGTRIHVYLPRAAAVVEASGETRAVALRGSETILVVEDDATVRRLAVRSLQQLGYEVRDAASVGDAHAWLARDSLSLDCLVMDLQLPDGQGRSAAGAVLGARRGVPVLFVSGSPEALATAADAQQRANAFLAKPFAPIHLARAIRALLDGARAENSVESR
jgi:PAS domain S-box-containing protein